MEVPEPGGGRTFGNGAKALYANVFSLTSVYAVGNAVHTVLLVILLPLYTHYLDTRDYGVLALMGITIALLSRTVHSPIVSALNRFFYRPDHRDRQGMLVFNLFVLLLAKTLVVSALFYLSADYVWRLLFESDPSLLIVVRLYALLLALTPVCAFLKALLRVLEMAKTHVYLSLVNALIASGLTVYLLVEHHMGVAAVVYGNIAGFGLVALFALPTLLRHSTFHVSVGVLKAPLKFGYPLLPSGYSNFVIQSGDRYVLRLLRTVGEVGLYSFGYNIANLLMTLIIVPVSNALAPTIQKLESDPPAQRRFIANAATYYYLAMIFAALALSLFAREALMLLARKEEFWESATIVPIIAFSLTQHGLANITMLGLAMRNKPYHMSGILVVVAALNVVLNFALIPFWGIHGAAVATLVSYLAWTGLAASLSARLYDLHFDWKRIGFVTVTGTGLYVLSLAIASGPNPWVNVAIKALLLVAYPLLIYTGGFVREQERELIKGTLRRIRAEGLLTTLSELRNES